MVSGGEKEWWVRVEWGLWMVVILTAVQLRKVPGVDVVGLALLSTSLTHLNSQDNHRRRIKKKVVHSYRQAN
jgi:hypothetical protein